MTDNLPIREPDQIRHDCSRKLRAVQVSDHFQAILGCLLQEDWTTPRLIGMVITPDGHILGRCDGEASEVHHVKDLVLRPDLAYSLENLRS